MSLHKDEPLHIVMLPMLAFGHMLPFFQLSKHLANKGNRVSFVSTPRNISRLPRIAPDLASSLHFVELPFPPQHAENLPDGAESTHDITPDKFLHLLNAMDSLEQPLAMFLESVSPDWIIYDIVHHWLPPLASKLGVQQVLFFPSSAAFLSFLGPPSVLSKGEYEGSPVEPEIFTDGPKWIPFKNNLRFRKFEILKTTKPAHHELVLHLNPFQRIGLTAHGCDIVAVRTDTEIEPEWLDLLQQKIYRKPVLPIGLLAPGFEDDGDDTWKDIKDWLDDKKTRSVVYVSFGSEATLSQEQTTELAIALELCELPFFWVCQRGSELLPTGFEERVGGRGLICKTWAPQLRILSHPSIGCFLTHCGWSSLMESLSAGCPLVLLLFANDQCINARMLTWKNIAFEIPRDEFTGWFSRASVGESLKKLVVDEEGESYRIKAKELKSVFRDTARQQMCITEFHRCLKEHQGNKGNQ